MSVKVLRVVVTGVLSVGALAGAACSDTRIPPGVLLSCDGDDECPEGLVCEPASSLCVPAGAGEELRVATLSLDPPAWNAADVEGGAEARVTFSLSSAPLQTPQLTLVSAVDGVERVAVVEGTDDPLTFEARLSAQGDEPDGLLRVLVDAIDARGVPRRLPTEAGLTVDATPPALANATLQRVPDAERTPVASQIGGLRRPAGPNVAVRVSLTLTEPVFVDVAQIDDDSGPLEVPADDPRAPAVTTSPPSALRFARDPTVANPLLYEVAWPDSAEELAGLDGSYTLRARFTDAAGNTTEAAVQIDDDNDPQTPPADAPLQVDVTPPAPPEVEVAGAVVLERAPWGRRAVNERDVFGVVGAAGAVEADAWVITSRIDNDAAEMGRAVAGADGSFVSRLASGDVPTVGVRAIDQAGNASVVVEVKDVAWIATLKDKEVGDVVANPHAFEELPVLGRNLGQGGAVEVGDEGVGSDDNAVQETLGAGTWERLPSGDSAPLVRPFDAALGHDPVRGLTVLLGGRSAALRQGPSPFSFVPEGACGAPRSEMFTRGRDDRWQQLSFAGTAVSPGDTAGGSFAFSSSLQELLYAGDGRLFAFNGASWRLLCNNSDQDCLGDGVSRQFPPGRIAWDPTRQVLVVHGFETYEWDGAALRRVCGNDTDGTVCPRPPATGSLVWSDALREALWFDGTTLSSWNGERWLERCTDDACRASAPPPLTGVQAAYDRERDELVAFTSITDAPCSYDALVAHSRSGGLAPLPRVGVSTTWIFDGALWRDASPAVQPPPRTGHTMAWDELRRRVVMVGGDDCDCMNQSLPAGFQSGLFTDTWEWDGSGWERVGVRAAPAGFTRANPPGSRDHRMVHDVTGQRVLLYGGDTDQLHVLVGDTWFAGPVLNPGRVARFQPALVSALDGRVFVFGGGVPGVRAVNVAGLPPFVWQLQNNALAALCDDQVQSPACGVPVFPFDNGSVPYGAVAGADGLGFRILGGARVLSLGAAPGSRYSNTATAEQWRFDLSTGWVRECADGSCGATPPTLVRHAGGVDDAGRFVVFGGIAAGGVSGQTWVFDGGVWDDRSDEGGPPARQGHVMAFDTGRGALTTSGGSDAIGDVFNGFTNPNTFHLIDPALDAVWEWADNGWHPARVGDVENDGAPAGLYGGDAAGHPEGGVIQFGGTSSPAALVGDLADSTAGDNVTWRWHGGDALRPAQRVRVFTPSALVRPQDVLQGAVVQWSGGAFHSEAPTVEVPLELHVWDGFGYRVVARSDDPDSSCGEGCVRAVLDAAATRAAIVGRAREIVVVAAPVDENGPAPGYVGVRTNHVDVTLLWRRP